MFTTPSKSVKHNYIETDVKSLKFKNNNSNTAQLIYTLSVII